MDAICTEIADFKVVPEITEESFKCIVNSLEENFHMKQKGYIDTELAKGNEAGQWTMIQHWETAALAIEASRAMMKEASAKEFREALDPKSVKIRYLTYAERWSI